MNKKFIQRVGLYILLFASSLFVSSLYGQSSDVRVTVRMEKVPMKRVMGEIERQTRYLFGYDDQVDVNRIVSVHIVNRPLVEALDAMVAGSNISYVLQGSSIVLKNRMETGRQSAKVSGKVCDPASNPIIGASVVVKGTTIGVSTDMEGRFTLEVPAPVETAVLNITYLGYQTASIHVGTKSYFDVRLSEMNQEISDVLVVGYAPMRKSDFTGSIASVKSSELAMTTPTVGQALVGKVAGVEVRQQNGAPGAGVQIRIRGINSLSASSDPLYVIDGYPASNDVYINPSDIESIDILKDAASAAIYGSRGASGVVLITTKRGKEGEKAKVTYEFSYGIQQLEHKVDLLDATEFRDLYIDSRNEAYRRKATAAGVPWNFNDDNATRAAKGFSLKEVGIHPMFYDFTTRTRLEPEYNTDWQDEVFDNAPMMRHNISVTGASKAVRYMASVGYLDQDGIISPSNHQRITARLNLDADITKTISASLSYSMYDVKNRNVQAAGRMIDDGIIQSTLMYLPNLPAYDENGDYARSAMIRMKDDWGINFPENPLVIANELDMTEKLSRHNLNFNLVYEPVEDLKLSARLGQQWYNTREFYYRPISIGRNASPAYSPDLAPYNIARSKSSYNIDRLGEFTLSYKKQIEHHHIDLLLGYTLQRKTYDNLGVEAKGFADDRIHEVTAHGPDPSDIVLNGTSKSAWSMMSYLARANYSFDNRYTITGTIRTDGSSRFGANNRWAYFPSISGGWTLSNEPFLKDALADIATIRLRASWGKSGNNDIGNYTSIANISTGSYAFGTTPVTTARLGRFADLALGWEITTQTNVGLDLGFLNGRIGLIANYYNSITTDILYNAPVSSISGFTSATTNMSNARLRNRGFDLQLDARILTGKVKWNVQTNISVNRNKVVSLGGLDDIPSVSERSVDSHITKEGLPIGSFYGYNAVGIMSELDYKNALLDREVYLANGSKFPKGYVLKGPAVPTYSLDMLSYGNVIWEDVNGDGLINTEDKTILGDAYPDFTGGFSTNLSWNGLDFSASFTYSYGAQVINFQDYYLLNMEGSSNQYAVAADRYISDDQPGRNNMFIASRTSGSNLKLPSFYVEDASYFRCSNITLGYTLPKRLLRKVGVESCRVYVSGDNLFTITPYRGYNPEVSFKGSNMMPGFDWGCYPLSRIYTVGLNLTF